MLNYLKKVIRKLESFQEVQVIGLKPPEIPGKGYFEDVLPVV